MNPADTNAPGTVTDGSVVENAINSNLGNPHSSLADTAEKQYEEKYGKLKEPVEETEENGKTGGETSKTDDKSESTPSSEESNESETASEEPEGYYADEGLEEETETPQTPPAQEQPLPTNFSAEEQYIAQNIGNPISVRIKVGEQIQTVQAYSVDNLPDNFEFATDKDRIQAQLGFDRIIRKAEQLQSQFQHLQQSEQAQKFESQENRDIQKDIAYLQRQKSQGKDGLALFKYAPDDERFDNDPAVKEMQEVLDYYNKENQARFESSQRNGTLYNRLSFRDAFRLYRQDNPKVGPKQEKEDKERKEVTRTLARGNRSQGEGAKQQRPKLPRNANIDQIARAYGL